MLAASEGRCGNSANLSYLIESRKGSLRVNRSSRITNAAANVKAINELSIMFFLGEILRRIRFSFKNFI